MTRMSLVAGVLICTLGLMLPVPANGSVLSLFQPGANVLEDDDFESVILDVNEDDLLSVGDRVFGVFRVQNVNGTVIGANDATVTATFALEVISKVGADGAATRLDFGPLQSGGVDAATTEWPGGGLASGVSTRTPTNDSTMAILFDHPAFGDTDPAAGSDIADATDTFDETTATSWLAEYGFAGEAGEVWSTTGDAGLDDPLNVISDGFATLNTLELSALVDNPADSFIFGSLSGQGTFVRPQFQDPGHFGLATDTDLVINAQVIPEPTMLLVFGGLFGIGIVTTATKRRKLLAT